MVKLYHKIKYFEKLLISIEAFCFRLSLVLLLVNVEVTTKIKAIVK